MADIRIDKVARSHIADEAVIKEEERRLHLFTRSHFENQRKTFAGIGKQDFSAIGSSNSGQQERGRARAEEEETISVRTRDGREIEMPRMSSEQLAEIDAILSQTTPEQAEHLVRSGQTLGQNAYRELEEGRGDGPYSLEATSSAQTAYEVYVATTGHAAHEKAVTGAVLFGMYGVEQNLKNYFGNIQDEQRLAADVRADVAELKDAVANWPNDGSTEQFNYREVVFNEDGTIKVVKHEGVEMTKGEAQALLERLEGTTESLGQFETQSMNHLQFMVQKYQQAMNTMSNIMKNMQDTHKAIIGNVR